MSQPGCPTAASRAILLDCGLGEAIKWGKPCHTHEGANITILQPMKDFLAVLFFKGALLDDPLDLLEEQGENTRVARRLCFTSIEQVAQHEAALRDLVREAIAAEEEGRALPARPAPVLAEELRARRVADPALKAAFEALTPGRQRAWNLSTPMVSAVGRRMSQAWPRVVARRRGHAGGGALATRR